MNNNATLNELYEALEESEKAPVLGVDFGNGQSTVYMHVPNQCTYRLRLDRLGNVNLLSALALIIWHNPETDKSCVMPLLSNSFTMYDALRRMSQIVPEELESDFQRFGDLVNLALDLMMASATQCNGTTLYIPLPREWQKLQDFNPVFERILKEYQELNRDDTVIFQNFKQVCCIGAQYSKLFQDFKRSPVQWKQKHSDAYPYTYKTLMKYYFTGLLRRLFILNPRIFAQLCWGENDENNGCYFFEERVIHGNIVSKEAHEREFRMVVGCPAYPEWTDAVRRREYSALLGEAAERAGVYQVKPGLMGFGKSGCDPSEAKEAPEIFPEPSAAILPHLTGNRQDKPNLNEGVAVWDSGSITNDLCLMYYAQDKTYRCNYSADSFGGARIEQLMLEILKRRLMTEINSAGTETVSMLDFDLFEDASNELFLRMVKENFYPECQDVMLSIHFHVKDQAHTVRFGVEALIHEALNKAYRTGVESADEKKSWLERAGEFKKSAMTHFCMQTGLRNVKFGSLILTGGTSRVKELCEIMEDEALFGRFEQEDDPSGCVGNGLALTISGEELEKFKWGVRHCSGTRKPYERMIDAFVCIVDRYVVKHINAKADEHIVHNKQCKLGEFGQEVTEAINADNEMMAEINVKIHELLSACNEQICRHVDSYAPTCFSGRLPIQLSHAEEAEKNAGGISEHVVAGVLEKVDIRSMLCKILVALYAFIRRVVISVLLCIIPGIGIVFGSALAMFYLIVDMIADGKEARIERDNKKVITKAKFEKLKKKINDEEDRKKNMHKVIEEALKKSISCDDLVNPLVEAAVRRVTMTGFDVDVEGAKVD